VPLAPPSDAGPDDPAPSAAAQKQDQQQEPELEPQLEAHQPSSDGPGGGGHAPSRPGGLQVGLVVAALGVVFGDISTSPLYALQTVFSIDHGAVRATQGDVYGVLSLMVWSVTLIVSIKYVGVVMRADNDGEGGVMALAALACRL
jgi:KUP system potassium uptake protein